MGRNLTPLWRLGRSPILWGLIGALLALTATAWLDRRQAARDADAMSFALIGEVMSAVTSTRGALGVANAVDENAERLHAISFARQQRRLLGGIYDVASVRLSRGLGTELASVLIPEILLPGFDVLHRCALLGRDRLRRPDGNCLTPESLLASLAICETAILNALDETVVRPVDAATLHDRARTACLALPGLPVPPGRAL